MALDPASRPEDSAGSLAEGMCATCRRIAYVSEGADMVCPVCSSPLMSVNPVEEATPETQAI